MDSPTLLVTMPADEDRRRLVEAELPDGVDCLYIDDVESADRLAAIESADALLSRLPHQELSDEELALLHDGQVVQSISAGVDHLPLGRLPEGVVLQSNAGAYAEPMAEHVLALYLALAKRLRIEHENLREGEFNQFRPNHQVDGSTCGVVGFGAIGQAAARRLKAVGVSILAINRSGEADEPAEFLGTPDDLEYVLREADGVVVAAPLTPETRGLFDREKLRWMADDATLINVARGELVDQRDLYEHLRENPEFQAGIDAWWTEPVRHGRFEVAYPFLDLPNVVGSPHNSAQVPGVSEMGLRHAVRNALVPLTDGECVNVVDRDLGY